MKRFWRLIPLLLAIAVGGTVFAQSAPPAAGSSLTIGLLMVGPYNDHGWSQANYDGVQYVLGKPAVGVKSHGHAVAGQLGRTPRQRYQPDAGLETRTDHGRDALRGRFLAGSTQALRTSRLKRPYLFTSLVSTTRHSSDCGESVSLLGRTLSIQALCTLASSTLWGSCM